jgi:hypothetical protein
MNIPENNQEDIKEAIGEVLEGDIIDDNIPPPPPQPEMSPEQLVLQQSMMNDIKTGGTTTIPDGMNAQDFVNSMQAGGSGASDPRMAAMVEKMKQKEAIRTMEKQKQKTKNRAAAKVAKASRKANR